MTKQERKILLEIKSDLAKMARVIANHRDAPLSERLKPLVSQAYNALFAVLVRRKTQKEA